VLKTRTTAEKKEIRRALVVQQVGLRRKAVPNVPRAVRVDLAVGVKIVHWVMPEQETTIMQRNVNNVRWVKQPRLKVPLNVMLVIRDNLDTPMVIVPPVRLVSIKPTEVKQNAPNATLENYMSMPKQPVVLVTLVRLATPKVFVWNAQMVFIKTT
jgi:hypothetical protein